MNMKTKNTDYSKYDTDIKGKYMKNKKAFIDIDGVIADFSNHFIQYYPQVEDKETPITKWDDERIVKWFYLTKNDKHFWLSIPRLVNIEDITFQISGYCTSRNCNPLWTKEWLSINGFPTRLPIISVNGSKVNALKEHAVDLFLDDAPHNYVELNNAGIRTYLLDRPYNRDMIADLRVYDINEFGIFAKPTFLIVGNKRHGKTTFAEMVREISGLQFSDSSQAASEIFIFDKLQPKYGYRSPGECFEDRKQHRSEWFDLICDYNKEDPTRLAREILKSNNIYVGMRNKKELVACQQDGIFDIVVGVYDKRKPLEDSSSFNFDVFDSDIVIENNGSLDDLYEKAKIFADDFIFHV